MGQERELHGEIPNWHEEQPDAANEETRPNSRRNSGNRVSGPWVVSLYESNERVCFFVVPGRSGSTLLSVIQGNVQESSVIVTDEWRQWVQALHCRSVEEICESYYLLPYTGN